MPLITSTVRCALFHVRVRLRTDVNPNSGTKGLRDSSYIAKGEGVRGRMGEWETKRRAKSEERRS